MVLTVLVLCTQDVQIHRRRRQRQRARISGSKSICTTMENWRQDSDGTWSFVFKNLGEEAIVINRVRSTCGCTVPDWPREPIEPGAIRGNKW